MLEILNILLEKTNIENRGMNEYAQGILGEFSEMIENALIRFKRAHGVPRIELNKDELWQKLSVKKVFE